MPHANFQQFDLLTTISRSFDADKLLTVMLATPALTHIRCDMKKWCKNPLNLAFEDGEGNFGVFEYEYPGVYTGHYFFANARGKAGIKLSRQILDTVFEEYEAKLVRGLTPIHHKAALWMNRQLGFKPYGVVDTVAGPCEIFVLTAGERQNV